MYVIALSVIVGAIGLYYYLCKDLNFFKKHGIPYKKPLPLLGNTAPLIFRRIPVTEALKSMYNIHPDAKYVGMYRFTEKVIVIRDPELIKSIALKHFDAFVDHTPFIDETHDPLMGGNLNVLRGDRWREMRSTLTPAFTSSKMKTMFTLMVDCGADFASCLAQLPPKKRIMQMKDVFSRYTSDVIATCAFGISVNSMKNPENKFYVYGKETALFDTAMMLKMFIFRSLPWLGRILRFRLVPEKITHFFRDLVESTIKVRDDNGIVRPDMLQLMMESRGKEGKELSIDAMVSQAFLFFFAGFDSTSSLMCFAAYEIAVNQDIQERLRNEIDQVLEETNGQASYEAINGMKYLDAVINETLRKYAIAGALDRLCIKDFELPPTLPGTKPFTVKKGQSLFIPIYGLLHDPKYFEEPEKFDPERFLGERKNDILQCGAYLPFGLGPRMCIGNRFALLETKVLFFHLLARCDLKPCEKTSIPAKIAKDGVLVRPEDGIWVNVAPTKNPHHTIIAKGKNFG